MDFEEGAVPSSLVELGTRINAIVLLYQFKRDAAEACGVSVEQLKRYVRGISAPPFDVLARLAAGKSINLNWLATGEGGMYGHGAIGGATVDEELVGRVADGIINVYKEEGAHLPPIEQGRLTGRIINKLVSVYEEPRDRRVGLKLALEELRSDLRKAAQGNTTSGKRQA